ncbi:MAG: hypothetical protein FJ290_29870 [Planctomycetes bacterium]|nr:hypothetical protein [Planctomycetota bacterium]
MNLTFPDGCAAEGYAVAVAWDPRILALQDDDSEVALYLKPDALAAAPPPDLAAAGPFASSKERIVIPTAEAERTLHLPRDTRLACLRPAGTWMPIGTVGQHPAALVGNEEVVFAFDPTDLIARYLNMMDTTVAADVLDWMAGCALRSVGLRPPRLRRDWRDFHALGVAVWSVERLAKELSRPFDPAPIRRLAVAAAGLGDDLGPAFAALAQARKQVLDLPIYFIDILHGGILIGREGFAEYDWPQAAADLLDFYEVWSRDLGYRYSHDVAAGTLLNLAPMFPETIARLRAAWDEGRTEFANGTWSQPYLHLWSREECRQQFVHGLAAFTELFGRRPTTYAAQEFALHPALPDMLREFGFTHAVHRVQNMGIAPDDDRPLIDWEGVGGAVIPTLPSHSPKSEKFGSGIYANWPRLVAETHRRGLPFVALVNLIDQTFIGAYKEEFVRACRFGDALGRFATCTDFFAATADVPRARHRYAWDDYVFDLEMPTNNYHRYESGSFSSTIEYWRGVVADMAGREPTLKEWRRVLDGEAHDTYVLPNFKTGAFLDLYLTDYPGPRYRVTVDERRGVTRFIRDAVGFPRELHAAPPVRSPAFTRSSCPCPHERPPEGGTPTGAELDPATGGVLIEGRLFGVLASTRGASRVSQGGPGWAFLYLDDVGAYIVRAWRQGDTVYGLVEQDPKTTPWFRHDVPYWQDCVYLRHALAEGDAPIIRYYWGIGEPTRHAEFYSRDRVTIGRVELLHGGNGFYRATGGELHNRLWSHNESARSFWWGVRVDASPSRP